MHEGLFCFPSYFFQLIPAVLTLDPLYKGDKQPKASAVVTDVLGQSPELELSSYILTTASASP